jgi:pyruvate dehydrogenase E2 component (dihydrolipoamide acetyltransferase)
VITAADVERAAVKPRPAPPAAPTAPATPVATQPAPAAARAPMSQADRKESTRRVIAAAMARSKREIPHYYLAQHIDLRRALAWLEAENLKRPVTARILPAALLLRATVLACVQFPDMNGVFVEGAYRPGEHVNLGVAISLRQGGLVAPAIMEAETKDLTRLMEDLKDLVKRTRAGTLRGSELSESTITVTNLGDLGVEAVYGVIYPPQVALVGFGKVTERPWAEGGLLGARPVVVASLSADHRVSDGLRGALFLAAIDRILQEPEKL